MLFAKSELGTILDEMLTYKTKLMFENQEVFDADWNAAYNIRNRYAKRPASFSLPLDGRLNLVGRRCQDVNRGAARPPCKLTASAVGI